MRSNHFAALGALATASILASCQQTPATTAPTETAPTATGPPVSTSSSGAPTKAEARAAIGRYIQGQPNANLYVVDSARATDLGTYWQVLVPRTDWARRMPNRAAFEVDKQTGSVKTLLVK